MRLRRFSILGWAMCQWVGQLHLSQPGAHAIVQAWCCDTEDADGGGRLPEMSQSLKSRFQRPDPDDTLGVLRHVKSKLSEAAEAQALELERKLESFRLASEDAT